MLVKHRHCFGASSESLEQSSDISFFVFSSGVAFFRDGSVWRVCTETSEHVNFSAFANRSLFFFVV